ACRTTCRPHSEYHADYGAEREREYHRVHRNGGAEPAELGQCISSTSTEQYSHQPTEQAEHHSLDQKLQQDVESRGTQSLPHADLASTLRDRDQHDVHDPAPSHDQTYRRDAGQQEAEYFGCLADRREEVCLVADGEVVRLSRPEL